MPSSSSSSSSSRITKSANNTNNDDDIRNAASPSSASSSTSATASARQGLKIKLAKRPRPSDKSPLSQPAALPDEAAAVKVTSSSSGSSSRSSITTTAAAAASTNSNNGKHANSNGTTNGLNHHKEASRSEAGPSTAPRTAAFLPQDDGAFLQRIAQYVPGSATSQPPLPPPPAKKRKRAPIAQVLPKIMTGLIKKDVYAFFLEPVNEEQVPGYSKIIANPMDLGTMKQKLDQDSYPTMDSFREDLLLLTNNAKMFNPPDSIYHKEANKIEDWGIKAIEREQAKGVLEAGQEPTPEPEPEPEPPILSSQPPIDVPMDWDPAPPPLPAAKKLSIKLKRRPSSSDSPQPPPKKGRKSTGSKSRLSSVLSHSQPSSRGSPSVYGSGTTASLYPEQDDADDQDQSDEGGEEDEDSSQDDRDGEEEDDEDEEEEEEEEEDDEEEEAEEDEMDILTNYRKGGVKVEEEEEEGFEDEDDYDHDSSRGQSASVGPGGSHRDSMTPAPHRRRNNAALMAKIRAAQPSRNAPLTEDATLTGKIKEVMAEAGKKGKSIDWQEAALQIRLARKNASAASTQQNSKLAASAAFALPPVGHAADGSIDLGRLRYLDRADAVSALGFFIDPGSKEPIFATSTAMPELSSVYPLHPDTQRHTHVLGRSSPQDPLGLALMDTPTSKETTGSHLEHGMPAGHQRMPVTIPTSTASGSAAGPTVSKADKHTSLPQHWNHSHRSILKDWEPSEELLENHPAAAQGPQSKTMSGPSYAGTNKARNKDQEREDEGLSNFRDWTFPHEYYSRAWDAASDLAIWKEVEVQTGLNGYMSATQPPNQQNGSRSSKVNATSNGFERWLDVHRSRRTKELLRWEEAEAVHQSVKGVELLVNRDIEEALQLKKALDISKVHEESEEGVLLKLIAVDASLDLMERRLQNVPSPASKIPQHAFIPRNELIRQAIDGIQFLKTAVWGPSSETSQGLPPWQGRGTAEDGEIWAHSLERFVAGAVQGVVDSDDEDGETEQTGGAEVTRGTEADMEPEGRPAGGPEEPIGAFKAEALFEDTVTPALAASPLRTEKADGRPPVDRLVDATIQGYVLPRSLYEYVRDEVVVPVSTRRALAALVSAGEWLRSHRGVKEGDEVDEEMKSLLQEDTDVLSQLASVLGEASAEAPVTSANVNGGGKQVPHGYLASHIPALWSRGHLLRIVLDAPVFIDAWIARSQADRPPQQQAQLPSGSEDVPSPRILRPSIPLPLPYPPPHGPGFAPTQAASFAASLQQYASVLSRAVAAGPNGTLLDSDSKEAPPPRPSPAILEEIRRGLMELSTLTLPMPPPPPPGSMQGPPPTGMPMNPTGMGMGMGPMPMPMPMSMPSSMPMPMPMAMAMSPPGMPTPLQSQPQSQLHSQPQMNGAVAGGGGGGRPPQAASAPPQRL